MTKVYLVPGKRTPFVKAGSQFAKLDSISLSTPVIKAMAAQTRPDFVSWGQVIPSPSISNLSRELSLGAGLDPSIPAFSTVLACSTSMMGAIQAAGMVGRGGTHLGMVGGVEVMSRVPIALKSDIAQMIAGLAMKNPAEAITAMQSLTADSFDLPIKGWANRISGRSMGEHTEDTAKLFEIPRDQQDEIAFNSHKRATDAQNSGFFDDLIVPVDDVKSDTIPRADSTQEKLATLKPVFDRSDAGTLTAGNSSPLTDGAGAVWVCDEVGLATLGRQDGIELVDWQIEAMDYTDEGILMAPARAIPKLLARHGLRLDDIALWEIHEAFAAQVLANIKMISDSSYRRAKAGVTDDLGPFPMDRLNPNGGSLAIGHPFGATGARIMSQACKELTGYASGSLGVVSICADGGQGTVLLLRRP
ncbi:acetyl-CoA C-acyltransferase [uncultured Tateyamaria sp.]|uniref:thiolase family protein n=1 Tax=uncultured Tateyamaria sp. TaxID=455651 RepID=UPI00260BC57F|nr:acetyl-CoA C-acyltransferase [uncultured Tateyamaria sp.]